MYGLMVREPIMRSEGCQFESVIQLKCPLARYLILNCSLSVVARAA